MTPIRFSTWEQGRFGQHAPNGAALGIVAPSWAEFATWLADRVPSDDKYAQPWSPLGAITSGKHGRRDAGDADVLALEYDDTATPALLASTLERLSRYDAVVYTTASATLERPRFRVVLRVSRPIATDVEWRACVDHVGLFLGAPPAPESRQKSRLWYRPITRCTTWRLDGGMPWDVGVSARLCPPPPAHRPKAPDPLELAALPVDARIAAAWQTLLRRKPAGAFAAGLIAHDHAVPPEHRTALVCHYAQAQGWQFTVEGIEARVRNVATYAAAPEGAALVVPVAARPTSDLDAVRAELAAGIAAWQRSGIRACAVIAPMGAGKTYWSQRLYAAAPSALYVAPTRALVADAARGLEGGVVYTNDAEGTAARGIVTAASLHHYGPDYARHGLVIFDEIVEAERQIHSSITRDKRRSMRAFVAAIATPSACLMLGADLSRDDVARYERWAGAPVFTIDLSGRTLLPRSVVETNAEHARHHLAAALRDPSVRRVAVFTDSSRECAALAYGMANDHPHRRVEVVHGKTDRARVALLNNGEWDVLIATHAMASGVSIDVEVDRIVVLRSSGMRGHVTPATVMQQIGRCRRLAGDGVVWVGSPRWEPDTRSTSTDALLLEAVRAGLPYDPDPIDTVIVDSWRVLAERDDRAWNDPGLQDLCRAAGWSWSRAPEADTFERPKAERDRDRLWRESEGEEYAAAVVAAPSLTEEQADALVRGAPTPEEHHALDRFALAEHLGPAVEVDAAHAAANRSDGRWVRAMRACAHVLDAPRAAVAEVAEDTATELTARRVAASVAAWRRWAWGWITGGVPVGADAVVPAELAAERLRALCAGSCSEDPTRLPYLGRMPRMGKAGAEVAWLRDQFGRFGVRLSKGGDLLTLTWPDTSDVDHYRRSTKPISGSTNTPLPPGASRLDYARAIPRHVDVPKNER